MVDRGLSERGGEGEGEGEDGGRVAEVIVCNRVVTVMERWEKRAMTESDDKKWGEGGEGEGREEEGRLEQREDEKWGEGREEEGRLEQREDE